LKPAYEILVVDDDAELADTLCEFLRGDGYTVAVAHSGAEALRACDELPGLALVLMDLMMPNGDGLSTMKSLHASHPDLPVMIMTGFATIETAVEAMKQSAEDYLTKPFDRDAVRKKVGRVMEVHRLRGRVAQLEEDLQRSSDPFGQLIYVSQQMQKVVDRARVAASSDASMIILGETGTGKERIARAVHGASSRRSKPFVAVNCGALPHELIESELFGARKGAFTGAYSDTPGVFVAAQGGTVFLDEIGEMPKEAQVKLLRVLQEREVRPLGSTGAVRVDIRVIAATNRPLAKLRGEVLREDLYFRLATVTIEIPPLRTRSEDVLVFAQWFTARMAEKYGRHITISRPALEALVSYSFPGNVRELENVIEGACALSMDDPQVITDRDLRHALAQPSSAPRGEMPLALEDLERVAIERAIRVCGGNRTRAATLLGISRDTLYRKLRELRVAAEGAG
jgi:DNA-binding NtrC family response regulator